MTNMLDRRAVMGAALLVPIAAAAASQPAQAADVSPELLKLIAEYKRLDAACDEYREKIYKPAEEMGHSIDAIDDHYNKMVDELCAAIYAIVKYPAANINELNLKISLIEKEDQFDCTGTDKIIIADVRRLARREVEI